MYESFCYDEKDNVLEHFWQWDSDRVITVKDIDTISDATTVQFHFCNRATETAPKITTSVENGVASATVPNFLLSQPYPIQVYIYEGTSEDEEAAVEQEDTIAGKTIWAAEIPVRVRPRPESIEYAELRNHVDTLKELVDEASGLESRLEEDIIKADISLETLNSKITEFNTEVENLTVRIDSEIEKINGVITDANTSKDGLQIEINDIITNGYSQKESLQAEINSIISDANTAKEALDVKIAEASEALNTLSALQQENVKAQENIAYLQKVITDIPLYTVVGFEFIEEEVEEQ